MQRFTILLCGVLMATTALAQPAAKQDPMYLGGRMDLANAYLRLERMLAAHPPNDARRTEVHKAFDQATLAFFAGQSANAIQQLQELSDSLANEPATPQARLMRSLRLRMSPAVAQVEHPTPLRIKLSPMYALQGAGATKLRFLIVPAAGGAALVDHEFDVSESGMIPSFMLPAPDAKVGKYTVQLKHGDYVWGLGDWFVAPSSMDQVRNANHRRLTEAYPQSPQMESAIIAARSRNLLLGDQRSETDASQFFADPLALAEQLNGEIDAIMNGTDPYAKRTGDYYRAFRLGALNAPARVYAPAKAVQAGGELPLVIALHGAGGDENLFMDGYGLGKIKQLADEHGFLVVSPATFWAAPSGDPVGGIIEAMSYCYSVDPKRVYLIGHSMGAMLAGTWNVRYTNQVAATVQIAGFSGFDTKAPQSPTLVIAAELDPLMPVDRIRTAAESADAKALGTELQVMSGMGHTLIVGESLTPAVKWLLKQSKP